jgi:hypothetical protein
MIRRLRVAALLAALLTSPPPAAAQVRLIEAGVVCPREPEGELLPAPGTEMGAIRQIDRPITFDLPAREVPTIPLLSFGFRAALEAGAGPLDVDIVIEHPPLGEGRVTRQVWSDTLWPGEVSTNLFTFEFDHEMVPGDWTFAIETGGARLLSVPFTVVPARASGPVEDACFQFTAGLVTPSAPSGSG